MGYALIAVSDPKDWAACHALRRKELFEAKGRFGVYDDRHPDDYADFAHPYLLKHDDDPVGTTRLDLFGAGRAAIRLVAITLGQQGKGHGRVLGQMVEERARTLGVHTLLVNAAPTAIGFYQKTGWERHIWDAAELVSIASDCIQMRKVL